MGWRIGNRSCREQPRLVAESAAAARNLACATELRGRLDETAAGRDELAAALAVAERCAGLAHAEAEAAADELRAARRGLAESEARRAHLECRIERAAACRPNDTGDGGPGPLEARVARLETGVRARDDRMCRIETAVVKAARRGGGRAKADGVHRGRRTDAAVWALVHKYSASAAAVAPAADGCPMRARLDALKCEINTLRDDVRDVCARNGERSAGSRRVLFD